MATGKKPDPKRAKAKHAHATYLKVGNGQQECGYKAGEIYGCYGHRTHAHQPCVLDITEGAISCPYCSAKMVPEWRGYLPVWDRDWTLRYCLIGEDHFPSADAIPHRAQVVISRAKNPISPLVVREELKLTRQLPDRPPWSEPVDMLSICLGLWKDAELSRWVEANKTAAKTDRAAAEVQPIDPSEKKLRRLAQSEKKHREAQKLADVMAGSRMMALLKGKANSNDNGKHPPNPEG